MVTKFTEMAAVKGRVIGPLGRAQKSIKKAISSSSKLTKRKGYGRRTGQHTRRQKRDTVMVKNRNTDIKGKLMYYNHNTPESHSIFNYFPTKPEQIVNISSYKIMDCSSENQHLVIRETGNDRFVCAKIAG